MAGGIKKKNNQKEMLGEDVSDDTSHGSILGKGPVDGGGLSMSIVSHLEMSATAGG